jgi:hypothetical protein
MMVKRGPFTGWRLAVLAAGLPMLEAVLIDVFAPSARALAPQASALGPFGVFHDLRWLLVYHRSWIFFIIELIAAIVIRGVLIGIFVREAWPEDAPKPRVRAAIARGIIFTVGAVVVLGPWAIIMFAQAVIPVSWFFFAAIPPFLIVAVLIHHASVSSWLRRPPLRVFGIVLLSFIVLSIGGALMTLAARPAGVFVAGAVGLFNAYAWRATVSGVVSRREARRSVLVPAILIAFLAVVIGGSAVGFAAKAPRATDLRTLPELRTIGKPVLIVKGFGGSYAGGRTYDLGDGLLSRRYSYAGATPGGLALPYKPADTSAPLGTLIARMDAQVRAFNRVTKQPVSIVAESEGSLIAERYLEKTPTAPVDRLIVLSPILGPGSVYYPPRGRDGWGVAAGWGLRGLASVMSAVSPLHFEADAPIVRDVVDEPSAFHDTCFSGFVTRAEFLPLADALAARADGVPASVVKVVSAFHGGLLGDPSVRARIRNILLNDPDTASASMRTLDTVVWAGAGAWRVPALEPSLNPAWHAAAC